MKCTWKIEKASQDGVFIGYCEALHLIVEGDGFEDTAKAAAEAQNLFFECFLEDGNLHETLLAIGWDRDQAKQVVEAPSDLSFNISMELLVDDYELL